MNVINSTSPAIVVLNWITAAGVIAIVGHIIGVIWEKRKLARSERVAAYATFLGLISRREHVVRRSTCKADNISPSGDSDVTNSLRTRIADLRDEIYDTYLVIKMVAPPKVVYLAYKLILLLDKQNNKIFNPENKGVPGDEIQSVRKEFVTAARRDLSIRKLDLAEFHGIKEDIELRHPSR